MLNALRVDHELTKVTLTVSVIGANAGVDEDVKKAAEEPGDDVEMVVVIVVDDDEMVAKELEEERDNVEMAVVGVVVDDDAEMEDYFL